MLGEQVYYTGSSENFASGNRLEHGKQGEVVGPATCESLKGKGVDVRFPGNKRAINCFLTQVRHRRRRAATPRAPRRTTAAPPPAPCHDQNMWRVWAHS